MIGKSILRIQDIRIEGNAMEIVIVATTIVLFGYVSFFFRKKLPKKGMYWEKGRWQSDDQSNEDENESFEAEEPPRRIFR